MRISTSGRLARVDLAPVLALLPALTNEWARLRFGADGKAVNPVTGEAVDAFALVDGTHRRTGARYAVIVETPKLELPVELKDDFKAEQDRLTRGKYSRESWNDYMDRRERASVRVGTERRTLLLTLQADDASHIAVSVTDERARWVVDVDMTHRRFPRVALAGRADVTGMLKDDDMPGCVRVLIGGSAQGHATVDLAAIEAGGTLLDGDGRARLGRVQARGRVRSSAKEWRVDGSLTVKPKGIGRIGALVIRRRRREMSAELQRFWGAADGLKGQVERLKRSISAEGGPAAFVHRALWDPTFDPMR